MPPNDYQRYVANERRKRRMKRIIMHTSVFVLIIIPASILAFYWTELIQKLIFSKVELEPGSDGYKSWLNPPISTTRSYYLFNITNPLDIVMDPSSTTIKFTDTPPYAYNIKTSKTNIQWSNDNKEISYAVERLYTRDPKRFNPSSVNDTGIFIDLVRASFRTQFEAKPSPAFFAVGGNNPFYHRNAVEQLEGFTSDLFNTVREKMVGPNKDKSGFVYRQNGSRLYNVSIQTDLMKKGQVLTFASELVPFNITSPSNYSFPVYDSLTYPANLFDQPSLNIFNSDFCRPILIEYKESVLMFDGINMHKYKVKLIDYNNCTNPSDTRTCNEVDKLDVSKCISESLPNNTIFLSKAHFYGSSNQTIEEMNIEGFTPTSDKHDSVLYFEPYSGTPFKATYRMQLNIEATIDPMKQSEDDSELKPTKKKGVKRLIPIFWIDQEIDISEEVINKLRTALKFRQRGPYFVVGVAIGLIIIIIIILEIVIRRAARNDRHTRGGYIKSETLVQR